MCAGKHGAETEIRVIWIAFDFSFTDVDPTIMLWCCGILSGIPFFLGIIAEVHYVVVAAVEKISFAVVKQNSGLQRIADITDKLVPFFPCRMVIRCEMPSCAIR